MKTMLKLLIIVFVAALIVAIVSTLKLNFYVQSIIYAVLVGLVIYIFALIMRFDK